MPGRLLEVSSISVECADHYILDNVSLCIHSGEVVGLLGPSGSGKSTLALTMMRLLPPGVALVRGSISFCGNDPCRIAMVFQDPAIALHPMLRVGTQLSEAVYANSTCSRKEAVEKAHLLLEEVHFPDPATIYRAYPVQLSGGQRQRVLIAQALSVDPSLLIADEPTSSLDTTTQAKILDLFRETICRRRLSMLFITHDPALIDGFAQRLIVLRDGKVVEEGPFEEVCRGPRDEYTRRLMDAMWPYPQDREVSRGV